MFTVDAIARLCRHLPAPGRRPLHAIAEPKLAATAVPVVDLDGEAAVILTQRPSTMTYHRGDWVFPGGRVDESDATGANAAVRELGEELGVPGEIVGQLDTHGPIVTGFLIEVFVVVVSAGATLQPDAREVSAVATVSLEHFLAPGNLAFDRPWPMFEAGPRAVEVDTGAVSPARDMPSFVLPDGDLVWGTQGAILENFLQQLTRLRELGLG